MIELINTPIPFWAAYLTIGAFLGIVLEIIDHNPFSNIFLFLVQQTMMTVAWPFWLLILIVL